MVPYFQCFRPVFLLQTSSLSFFSIQDRLNSTPTDNVTASPLIKGNRTLMSSPSELTFHQSFIFYSKGESCPRNKDLFPMCINNFCPMVSVYLQRVTVFLHLFRLTRLKMILKFSEETLKDWYLKGIHKNLEFNYRVILLNCTL